MGTEVTTAARRIAAIPLRTSVETWRAVCALLTPADSAARKELEGITSVAAVLIAEEYTAVAPIIVTGSTGPRVRVYTVHGEDAIEAQDTEMPLSSWPCESDDWQLSLPCSERDLTQIQQAIARNEHLTARDLEDGFRLDSRDPSATAANQRPTINLMELEQS